MLIFRFAIGQNGAFQSVKIVGSVLAACIGQHGAVIYIE